MNTEDYVRELENRIDFLVDLLDEDAYEKYQEYCSKHNYNLYT